MAIVKRIDPATLNLKEQVVAINRVTKVVKGGKNLSFSALVFDLGKGELHGRQTRWGFYDRFPLQWIQAAA